MQTNQALKGKETDEVFNQIKSEPLYCYSTVYLRECKDKIRCHDQTHGGSSNHSYTTVHVEIFRVHDLNETY
jgi:hypothetical protein